MKPVVKLLILLIFVVTLFLTTFLLFSAFILFSNQKESDRGHTNKSYRYVRYSPKTENSRIGKISMKSTNLGEDGFISYQDDSGNHYLVSNFDQNEYKCSGTCVCEELSSVKKFSEKRRSSISLSRGVTYLLTSLSSVLAMRSASKYFRGECHAQFSEIETCDPSSIRSEVNSCDPLFKLFTTQMSSSTEDEDDVIIKNDEEIKYHRGEQQKTVFEKKDWDCVGKCLTLDHRKTLNGIVKGGLMAETTYELALQNIDMIEDVSSTFGCEKMELKERITVEMDKSKEIELELSEKMDDHLEARRLFGYGHLAPYCFHKSTYSFLFPNKWGQDHGARFPVCGANPEVNLSIECEEAK